jgi:hypothetical protein
MSVPPAKPQLDLFEHVENAFKANPNRPLAYEFRILSLAFSDAAESDNFRPR